MGELIWFALLKSLLPFAAYDWVWVASSLGGLRAQSAIGSAERRERNQTNPINRAKRAKQPNHQLNSLSLPPSLLRTKSGVDVLMGLSEFVLSFLSSPSSLSGLGAVGPPQRSAKRERTAREREKREQMNEAKRERAAEREWNEMNLIELWNDFGMKQSIKWMTMEWEWESGAPSVERGKPKEKTNWAAFMERAKWLISCGGSPSLSLFLFNYGLEASPHVNSIDFINCGGVPPILSIPSLFQFNSIPISLKWKSNSIP